MALAGKAEHQEIVTVTTGIARDRSHDVLAVTICAIAATFWISFNFLQYKYFGYTDWDLALYAQVVRHICHGSCQPPLLGINFLGNHSEFIAFLAAPVYCLFSHPLTLVVLNVLLFVVGAYVFYLIVRRKLGQLPGLVILAVYLLHPANFYMLSYEFHFESFAPCLIFLAYYFFERDRWWPFLLTCLILCLVKENMPTIVVMFGFLGLFFKKKDRWLWGLAPIAMGGAVFYLDLFVLIPYFHKTSTQSVYWGMYQSYGHTPTQIAANIATQPTKLLSDIFSERNRGYLLQLFGPHFVPAIFSPQILALGLPIFLQNLLSSTWTSHTIYFHYAATLVPCILLATVDTFSWIQNKMRPAYFVALVWLLLIAGIGHAGNQTGPLLRRMEWWSNPGKISYDRFAKQVDKKEPVVASFSFLSHLTERSDLYAFHYIWKGANMLNGQPFTLPGNVRCALIDFDDPEVYARFFDNPAMIGERIKREFLGNGWMREDSEGDLVLLRKDAPGRKRLVEVLPADSPEAAKSLSAVKAELNPQIVLADMDKQVRCSSGQGCQLTIRFDWLSRTTSQKAHAIRLALTRDHQQVYVTEHVPGYLIYPPALWQPGEIIREYYSVQLPPAFKGAYDLNLGLIPVRPAGDWRDHTNEVPLEKPMQKIGSINVN